jgi:HD superfamily phosphodiesterase
MFGNACPIIPPPAAERLAGDRPFDRELLLCACWLHDLGLFTVSRDPYVTEGARLAPEY